MQEVAINVQKKDAWSVIIRIKVYAYDVNQSTHL